MGRPLPGLARLVKALEGRKGPTPNLGRRLATTPFRGKCEGLDASDDLSTVRVST